MASIRDVARKANVAACTVSRVLNGNTNVSEGTREKIKQAMAELDYIPNELARSMFRKKTGIIAMLVPSIRHPYFSSLANYIEKELYQHGYKLLLCSTGDTLEREEDYLETFKTNLVDGIIMGVYHLEDEQYLKINKPMIMLDYQMENIPVVVSDHVSGGKLAAQIFIKSGCEQVLHLLGESEKQVLSYQSHTAMKEELSRAGIKTVEQYVEWNEFDFSAYLELARELLYKNPQIDGFMGADMPAIAFLQAARESGRQIPNEFAVVAYDGTYVVDLAMQRITTIRQPLKSIAAAAVAVINELFEGKQDVETYTLLPVELVEGESTL